jgi:hypothetical protein
MADPARRGQLFSLDTDGRPANTAERVLVALVRGVKMLAPRSAPRTWVGLATILSALGIWYVADRYVGIGPFDRAQATGLLALPVFLISPWTVSLGLSGAQDREVWNRAALFGVGVAAVVAAILFAGVTQIGCRPVAFPAGVVEGSIVAGLAGASFAISVRVAAQFSREHRAVASILFSGAVLAIGLSVTYLVFALLYPAASCPKP